MRLCWGASPRCSLPASDSACFPGHLQSVVESAGHAYTLSRYAGSSAMHSVLTQPPYHCGLSLSASLSAPASLVQSPNTNCCCRLVQAKGMTHCCNAQMAGSLPGLWGETSTKSGTNLIPSSCLASVRGACKTAQCLLYQSTERTQLTVLLRMCLYYCGFRDHAITRSGHW